VPAQPRGNAALHRARQPEAGSTRVARLPAVLDFANVMDVRHELDELLVNGMTILIADMTATVTLEGLQALVLVRAAAARAGGLGPIGEGGQRVADRAG
jgi:hypothetical protein